MIKILIILSLTSYTFANNFQTVLSLAIEAGLIPLRIKEQAFSPRLTSEEEVLSALIEVRKNLNNINKVKLFDARYRNLTYSVYSDLSTDSESSSSFILDTLEKYKDQEISSLAKAIKIHFYHKKLNFVFVQ